MVSELALTGPIAWALIAVAPLVLLFAALVSLRSRGVRQAVARGELAVGDSAPPAVLVGEASRDVVLGISAPLTECVATPLTERVAAPLTERVAAPLTERVAAPQPVAAVPAPLGGSGDDDIDDIAVDGLDDGPAVIVEEENRNDGTGSRLVKFPTIEAEDARVSKLDSVQVADARAQISRLEAARLEDEGLGADSERLALLYLQVGEALFAEGSGREGAEHVCKSLELSIPGKYDLLQAQGRMALGEIAVVDGDFSGACEQWQMAAEMFRAAGLKDPSRAIGSHMHKCGCPTDWVLTDF